MPSFDHSLCFSLMQDINSEKTNGVEITLRNGEKFENISEVNGPDQDGVIGIRYAKVNQIFGDNSSIISKAFRITEMKDRKARFLCSEIASVSVLNEIAKSESSENEDLDIEI